ncbi:hypothetical protein [Paracoccus litorisediminis]|uniref:Uncharacterized protein n=1 Tax=Paracoccus litorisediminis TaxID=2006130 RepID=A0A844HP44_9RHOB|nr:hypothetical protein [Paracoccus litorisediminis]MTH62143.1 hypothetical protein [Paracoccus litorisediminis]
MDEFLHEVEMFASARGIKPSSVIQAAVNASGLAWARWRSGKARLQWETVARVRTYMREQRALEKQAAEGER